MTWIMMILNILRPADYIGPPEKVFGHYDD